MDDRTRQLILWEAQARQAQVDLKGVVGLGELFLQLDTLAKECRDERLGITQPSLMDRVFKRGHK